MIQQKKSGMAGAGMTASVSGGSFGGAKHGGAALSAQGGGGGGGGDFTALQQAVSAMQCSRSDQC